MACLPICMAFLAMSAGKFETLELCKYHTYSWRWSHSSLRNVLFLFCFPKNLVITKPSPQLQNLIHHLHWLISSRNCILTMKANIYNSFICQFFLMLAEYCYELQDLVHFPKIMDGHSWRRFCFRMQSPVDPIICLGSYLLLRTVLGRPANWQL